jgi:hypothetical protein
MHRDREGHDEREPRAMARRGAIAAPGPRCPGKRSKTSTKDYSITLTPFCMSHIRQRWRRAAPSVGRI